MAGQSLALIILIYLQIAAAPRPCWVYVSVKPTHIIFPDGSNSCTVCSI